MTKNQVARDILRRLLQQPRPVEYLYRVLVGCSDREITDAASELVHLGIVAVTVKRFWIRDRERAMRIINEQETI